MKTKNITNERLFIRPIGQYTNDSIVNRIGDDIKARICGILFKGKTIKVIELNKLELEEYLESKAREGFKFDSFIKLKDENELRQVEFFISGGSISIKEQLDRQIAKHIIAFGLLKKPPVISTKKYAGSLP